MERQMDVMDGLLKELFSDKQGFSIQEMPDASKFHVRFIEKQAALHDVSRQINVIKRRIEEAMLVQEETELIRLISDFNQIEARLRMYEEELAKLTRQIKLYLLQTV